MWYSVSDIGIGATGVTLDAPLFSAAPVLFLILIHREK